jgi:hypothetical protein
MLSFLATLLAAVQPTAAVTTDAFGQPAWIFATIHHSEWCPSGNVRLDLRTGQFALTAGAARSVCDNIRLERPVVAGTLAKEELDRVLAGFQRVQAEGVEKPVCRDGGRPDEIIISNGGTPLLVLATGAETGWPPSDLTCWSDAANSLHDVLEDIFSRERKR